MEVRDLFDRIPVETCHIYLVQVGELWELRFTFEKQNYIGNFAYLARTHFRIREFGIRDTGVLCLTKTGIPIFVGCHNYDMLMKYKDEPLYDDQAGKKPVEE